jgi:hypothetical protein
LSTRITYIIAPTEGKTKTSTQNLNCIFDLHRQQSFLNSDDYHFEMKKKKVHYFENSSVNGCLYDSGVVEEMGRGRSACGGKKKKH